jgi:hypothetical protein
MEGNYYLEHFSSSGNVITTFDILSCIADGKFTKNGSDGPFKYNNAAGESFAMLFEIIMPVGILTFANSIQIVPLTHMRDCVIQNKEGLYGGYEVRNENGELITQHEIYQYKDIFFLKKSFNDTLLHAQKPNSGILTKPAAITMD